MREITKEQLDCMGNMKKLNIALKQKLKNCSDSFRSREELLKKEEELEKTKILHETAQNMAKLEPFVNKNSLESQMLFALPEDRQINLSEFRKPFRHENPEEFIRAYQMLAAVSELIFDKAVPHNPMHFGDSYYSDINVGLTPLGIETVKLLKQETSTLVRK
ncbi:MAG: hypothetical protein ABSD68_01910 [Candidatus Micrarchaeales archaeon]|jgi:hypothetical protein